MGDMKTPDFDDLLAAFDIPDATSLDAKEAIQENHDDGSAEGHLKHAGMCLDDGLSVHHSVATSDVPAVSVIVKNTSRQESLESVGEREGPPLQNGFRGPGISLEPHLVSHSGSLMSTLNGDSSRGFLAKAPVQHKPEGTPSFSQAFNQFSPISSPETEDIQSNGVDVRPNQERPYFPDASVPTSIQPPLSQPPLSNNQKKLLSLSMFDQWRKEDAPGNILECRRESTKTEEKEKSYSYVRDYIDRADCQSSAVHPTSDQCSSVGINCNTRAESIAPANRPCVKASKLSSCLEALVALNARKDPGEQTNPGDPFASQSVAVKISPRMPLSPPSPCSPLDAVKHLLKPPDSPCSVYSDSSGKASPALASGSSPAIPRVRIKTIKTTTGQIKRTVTSVLPDSETEDMQSACESSPSRSFTADESYAGMSPYQPRSANDDHITGGPVKSLPGDTQSANVPHIESEGTVKKAALVQSPTIFHNSSSPAMKSISVPLQGLKQKQIASTQAGGAANTSFLPKAMHLANLNLVPHSVAATVTARAVQQQSQPLALPSSPAVVCSTVPLVHQVKQAAPAPNTAAPSSAAGTLNRLLNNANPVPTYVPNLAPPPECNISLPPRGYCCLECGDSFGVERSLTFHYSRRSVHIEVACTLCAKTMVFFNKCALLAHARGHKSKGTVMQCSQLFMKPIAEGQMFAPLRAEPSHEPPTSSAKGQPVMPLYPDKVIRHRLRCLECNDQLSDYRALAGHYQRLSDEKDGLMCKLCSMLLPNKCSFRAHQRIHAHKSPYCCPECGALSRSVDIQKHVKENCLHYARKAGYKCLHCERVFTSFSVQKSHIEDKHCEVFYKCSICPVAFKSSEGCQLHMKNKHKASRMSHQFIFKCSCETVFKKKQLLFQHFHQKAKQFATCVFKCPECTSVFTHKLLLMQHFKSVHGGVFKEELEKSTKPTERTSQHQDIFLAPHQQKVHSPVKHPDGSRKKAGLLVRDGRPSVRSAGWTCGDCLLWLPDRDTYLSHMKSSHGRSLKKYPCRQCERSFNSSTSLRRHIRNDHDSKKKTFTCWYCTDEKRTFPSSVALKNHISLMHGIKNPDFSLMTRAATQDLSKTSGEELLLKRPAMDSRGDGPDSVTCPGGPSAKRLKTQFRCSKCGFVTGDSAQFQQHIPQHRTDEDTPQCLHCGLCFTSRLSLNRHLFIVHKIKDTEEGEGGKEERKPTPRDDLCREEVKTTDVNEIADSLPQSVEANLSRREDTTRQHCEKTINHFTSSSRVEIPAESLPQAEQGR